MSPDEFAAQFLPYARYLAFKNCPAGLDVTDILSDAHWGLALAATTYREESSPPAHWATRKIQGAIIDGLRSRLGRHGQKDVKPVSLDTPDADGTRGDRIVDDGRELDEVLDRVAVAQLLRRLSDEDRWVVTETHLRERSLADVAAERGVTESRVCQIRGRAMRRLREVAA